LYEREKCGAASRVLPVLLAVCLIFTLFPAPRANATMSSMYGYVDNWKVTSSGANRYTYDGGYHNAGALSVGTVVTICSVIDTGWGSTPDGYCVLVEGSSKEAKCFTRMNGGFPDTGTYITGSSAVKVHNKPSGDGTVVGTVPANTVVNIKRTCFNTSGNPWGENADGNWIYLGYLTKHTHQAAMCGAPSTTYAQKDENSHYKYFYNGDELCSCGQYMGKGTTTTTVEAHTFMHPVRLQEAVFGRRYERRGYERRRYERHSPHGYRDVGRRLYLLHTGKLQAELLQNSQRDKHFHIYFREEQRI